MTSYKPNHPKVFISYSHDSPAHADRVLELANRLRADGIDCILDQYEASPPEGWPRWMGKQIRDADFVLMICTEIYYRRVMGEEEPGKGLGVCWESNLIYQYIYNAGTLNTRFIPILLQSGRVEHIPTPLQGVTYYRSNTDNGYEDLYRRLSNQPRVKKPELGKLRPMPPLEREQDFLIDLERSKSDSFCEILKKYHDQHVAVTVVFTDVEDSTKYNRQLGNERWGQIRDQHFAIARELISSTTGCLIKTIGDSVMAAFVSASDGARFALEFQRSLRKFTETLAPEERFLVRVGLHNGDVQVKVVYGRPDLFGSDVNRAARVEGMAWGGQIYATAGIRRAVEDRKPDWSSEISWYDHGEIELKGFEQERERILELLNVRYSQTPRPPRVTPRPLGGKALFAHTYPLQEHFIGRRVERKKLSEWLRGEGEHAGKSVLVLEAIGGMGKSSHVWVWAKRDIAGEEIPGPDGRCAAEPVSESVPTPRLDGLLYWSFYEGGGSFEGFLERAIEYMTGGQRTVSHYIYEEAEGKRRINYYKLQLDLLEILSTRRILLIWDGAERLLREYAGQDTVLREERPLEELPLDARDCADLAVARFLVSVAGQSSSRLLLTSRLPFRDLENLAGAGHLMLESLDPNDAVRYLKARGIRGTDGQLHKAAQVYEFHPMSLSNLAADILQDFDEEGDISAAYRHDPTESLRQRREHILERAYNRREPRRRELLSRLAAVHGTIHKNVVCLLAKGTPVLKLEHLGQDLHVLVKHGLLKHLPGTDYYNFHPVVRRYAYNRLANKAKTHARLVEYFQPLAAAVDLDKVEKIEDLSSVIELYYHTARSGQYDEAFNLFKKSYYESKKDLNSLLYHEFGTYRLL